MSDEKTNVEETNEVIEDKEPKSRVTAQTDELKSLKSRADIIGLKYHPNIGLAKLKEKVNSQLKKDKQQLAAEKRASKAVLEPVPSVSQEGLYDSPDTSTRKRETPVKRKMRLRKKASRLIRFRLTCMNEAKKKWPGETFTVSNSVVGTIKRHIPFNADAWHCEEMLLNMIKEKTYTAFYEVKGLKGRPFKKTRLVKEFAIEILPPLTNKELYDLKTQQALRNNLED